MTRVRLGLFFIAAGFAIAAASSTAHLQFLVQSGHEAWANGGRLDQQALIAKYGDHFAAVVRDGRTYVVIDASWLARFQELYTPVSSIANSQASLGQKQAHVGERQAQLGMEQARIGAQQAALAMSDDREAQRALSDQQKKLSDRQRTLSDEQKVLSDQQQALHTRMETLSERTMPKLERLFDDAIAAGKAHAE